MGSGDGSYLDDVSCTCWRHVRVIRDPRVTCGRTDQLLMRCRSNGYLKTAILRERDSQLKLIKGNMSWESHLSEPNVRLTTVRNSLAHFLSVFLVSR